PDDVKAKYNRSSLSTLLTSSAPVRKQTKIKIMEFFPNARLFEAYGSTEAGLVTILRPDDQMTKLGSVGRECIGSDRIRILDSIARKEVPDGEIGELFSSSPMMFTEYLKLPEKTAKSFNQNYFSAGDMAKRDTDGYYYLVDRKDNMVITGGEKVFPSEIEEVITECPGVAEVAVIGVPHEVWGEAIHAVIVRSEDNNISEEQIMKHCSIRLANFKRPKSICFVSSEEMPRTASGKILHRVLRERNREA
ncbi:MAG TPA: AMP-binding protein, partial [Candidatus Hodarchaeales archaeon]|nr:AMP-binding protein [Candidatus Hodarchaeales archaeon]